MEANYPKKNPWGMFHRSYIQNLKVLQRLEVGQSHDQRRGEKIEVKCKKKNCRWGGGSNFPKNTPGECSIEAAYKI